MRLAGPGRSQVQRENAQQEQAQYDAKHARDDPHAEVCVGQQVGDPHQR
jgi:hypothetical protein